MRFSSCIMSGNIQMFRTRTHRLMLQERPQMHSFIWGLLPASVNLGRNWYQSWYEAFPLHFCTLQVIKHWTVETKLHLLHIIHLLKEVHISLNIGPIALLRYVNIWCFYEHTSVWVPFLAKVHRHTVFQTWWSTWQNNVQPKDYHLLTLIPSHCIVY